MHEAITILPQASRLALAYAPASKRPCQLALLALDARLAELARGASEPVLAQLRLAWWRDLLDKPAEEWPQGDPVVTGLQRCAVASGFVCLVDGWEALATAENLDERTVDAFSEGRAKAWASLAASGGELATRAHRAGRVWALGDLAGHVTRAEERATVITLAENASRRVALPKAYRALSVLAGLGVRSLSKGGSPLLSGPGDLAAAMRLGIFGR